MRSFDEAESIALFAARIEHTLLRPEATPSDIERLCAEAAQFKFATVCVNSAYTKLAAEWVRATGVVVTTTVAFPFGASNTPAKLREAEQAIADGASELDMVIAIGWLRAGCDDLVFNEIEEMRSLTAGKTLKVILETALLTDVEKIRGAGLASDAGADFVKTSTGFARSGAEPNDVRLLRRALPPSVRIKAAGGIRSYAQARTLIAAGADRLGVSHGVRLMEELAALKPPRTQVDPLTGRADNTKVSE